MLKRICAGAALFAAIVLLCSCDNSPSSPPTGAVSETAAATDSFSGASALVEDGVCLWRVVRPEMCSEEVLLAARSIDAHLFNRFEVHIESKNDLAAPVEREILVGLTDRPESAEVFSTLGANRYAVREVNCKIVLIGENDRATAKAVDVFLSGWIDSAPKPSEGEKARVELSIGEGRSGLAPL